MNLDVIMVLDLVPSECRVLVYGSPITRDVGLLQYPIVQAELPLQLVYHPVVGLGVEHSGGPRVDSREEHDKLLRLLLLLSWSLLPPRSLALPTSF